MLDIAIHLRNHLAGDSNPAAKMPSTTAKPTTKYTNRAIPQISLRNFPSRIEEITTQLCSAAENVGFFALTDHSLPQSQIEKIFTTSESFFSLPDNLKATVPWTPQNVGWEKNSQIRPSTGAADQKESYQLQFGENMEGLWISEEHVPRFREEAVGFMREVQGISEMLMVCFARGLGFEEDYFVKWHDAERGNSQSALRLLHYFATPEEGDDGRVLHRAGAHADWVCWRFFSLFPGMLGMCVVLTFDGVGVSYAFIPEGGTGWFGDLSWSGSGY
jgi:isopenicillin N synthase-like dioxygenase